MVSSGLGMIAKDLLGLEKNVVNLQDKFKALKLIGVGWGLSHVGGSMLGFMGKTIEASKEYTHQVSQLGILGMKQADIAQVISASWKTSRDVMTSSAADNIEAYREMRAVFGSGHEHEALAMLPMAQRASAILASLTGQMHKVKDVGYDMAKAAELTTVGGMTDAQMQKRAEQFMQASIAFGGKVSMQDFHGALKMTRGASLNYNDDFISHYLPTLIQEMKSGNGGGQQAGTLLRNFDRAVVQQVIPLNKLQNWEDAGLIKDGHVVWNKHHTGLKKITPGGVVGQDVASQSPYQWWQQYGEAAVATLMKKGGLTDIQAISALATNQMTADLFKKLHFQHAQFERDKKMIDDVTAGGGSKAKYDKLLQTDPLLAQQAMQKQWSNVQARIGYEILPRLIPYMIKFADALDGIGQWMQKNPGKLQIMVAGFGALAVSMWAVGKVLMIAGFIKLFGLGPALMGLMSPLRLAGLAMTGLTTVFAAFVAYKVGNMIGTWLNDEVLSPLVKFFSDGKALSLGDWIYQKANGDGNDALGPMHYKIQNGHAVPVPPKQSGSGTQIIQLHVDGKKMAEVVTKNQARAANAPATGSPTFDKMMSVLQPGMPSMVGR